jgi:hypothetical protein
MISSSTTSRRSFPKGSVISGEDRSSWNWCPTRPEGEAVSLFRLDAFGFLNHPSAHQKGGVCNAKYPKSWIVNIAAQMISIRIKARALNSITPPQRVRIVALREALMRRLPLF